MTPETISTLRHYALRLCLTALLLTALAPFTAAVEYPPEEYISGTLPVLYINTDDGQPITSKEYYISGTYWLDSQGQPGIENIGSADQPLPLEIKGRGNATWRSKIAKKPYRLKLAQKANLCGMGKSKHWVMLNAYGKIAFFTDPAGFEMSRRAGLAWTPALEPVEVVLNGEYFGVYFLCEKIRVDKKRVNIEEQADGEEDPQKITGGWLTEIDNVSESYDTQLRVYLPDNNYIRITWHSPDSLSQQQHTYLTDYYGALMQAIYCRNKSSREWERYIDLDTLARFYIVNELFDEQEAFIGSCYMHKQRGDSTKLLFGPVWDFGYSFARYEPDGQAKFIYEGTGSNSRILPQLAQFPRFQQAVRELWPQIRDQLVDGFEDYVYAWQEKIDKGARADYRRWRSWGSGLIYYVDTKFLPPFRQKVAMLDSLWLQADTTLAHLASDPAAVHNKTYRITDTLSVAGGSFQTDSAFLFVTDRHGEWLRLAVPTADYEQLMHANCFAAGSVRGIFNTQATLPTLTVFGSPQASSLTDELVLRRLKSSNCDNIRNGEVVRMVGRYTHADNTFTLFGTDLTFSFNRRWVSGIRFTDGALLHLQVVFVRKPDGQITLYPIGTYLPERGDINNDDIVDLGDLNTMVNVMAGREADDYYFQRADINGDGIIDVTDINEIVNIMLCSPASVENRPDL